MNDTALYEYFMREALKDAQKAMQAGDVPVGSVVVYENRIIGRGYNRVESLQDPTAHAEIIAIGAAAGYLGTWRLEGAHLYATLEPCAMCAGALVLSRISKLTFGTADPKAGACGSVLNIPQNSNLNHFVHITEKVLEPECREILISFFKKLRSENN